MRPWESAYWVRFWEARGARVIDAGWRVLITLVVLAIALVVVRRIIDRTARAIEARVGADGESRRVKQAETLRSILRSVAGYAIVIVGVVTILANVGVDIKTIVAGLGVVGLAFSFGAQALVRDVLAGFFILVEDQYAVGDFVSIGGQSGYVEEIGMRFTRIVSEDGKRIWVSNGSISTVVNHSRGSIEIRLKFALAASAGVDAIVEKMKEIAQGLPGGAQFDGIADVAGANVVVEFSAHAAWTEREQVADRLRQEIARRIQAAGLILA
jgi:small-conductance mechanosensitive channel